MTQQERKPLPVPPKKIIAIVSPEEAAAAAANKAADKTAPSKPVPEAAKTALAGGSCVTCILMLVYPGGVMVSHLI